MERSWKFPDGQFITVRGVGACGFIIGFDSETGKYLVDQPATMCGWIRAEYSERHLIKSRKTPEWAARRLRIREYRKTL